MPVTAQGGVHRQRNFASFEGYVEAYLPLPSPLVWQEGIQPWSRAYPRSGLKGSLYLYLQTREDRMASFRALQWEECTEM